MSIASEITRLQGVKSDILTAIADKGVTVPAGSALDDCPYLIMSIISNEGRAEVGGRIYKTVKMPDEKIWLAENLDFKFSGCNIGGAGTPSTPNAWYYDNDEFTYGIDGTMKCGLLYNWYAVKLLNDNRNDLIPGWHVPTAAEWDSLAYSVGGSSLAGTKIKALDNSVTSGFPSGWNGINNYGFSALPAGRYDEDFRYINQGAHFWTATENDSTSAFRRYMSSSAPINSDNVSKKAAFSLRLVKDS